MTPSNICVMNSHAACCEDDHIILDDKHENKWKKDPWRTVQDHRDLRKDLPKTPQSISEAARNTQFTQQRSHTVSSAKHCQGSSLGFVWFGALKFKAVRSREQQTWRQHSEVFYLDGAKTSTITSNYYRRTYKKQWRAPLYVNQMCSPSHTVI